MSELETILNIAGKHRQCVFFLLGRVASFCEEYLEDMTALGNVVLLIQSKDLLDIAHSLKQAGMLFGFHRDYREIHSLESEERFLRQCIEAGCILGVYEGDRHGLRENQESLCYAKLREIRRSGAQEILLADLWRDREMIQNLLLYQQILPDHSHP